MFKCHNKLEVHYNQRRYLKSKDDNDSTDAPEKVEDYFANRWRDNVYEWKFNPEKFWKLKKTLSLRHMEPPTELRDTKGMILTTIGEVKAEDMKFYKSVF